MTTIPIHMIQSLTQVKTRLNLLINHWINDHDALKLSRKRAKMCNSLTGRWLNRCMLLHTMGLKVQLKESTSYISLLSLHNRYTLFMSMSVLGGGGGGLQNGKITGPNSCPPPSRQGKTFHAPPPFNEWKLFALPFHYG